MEKRKTQDKNNIKILCLYNNFFLLIYLSVYITIPIIQIHELMKLLIQKLKI